MPNRTHPSPAAAASGHDSAWTTVFLAWLVAAVSTLGALFFSEVMKLPPCELCWWQRIFMFPLVLILPAGLFPLDPRVVRYALPLAFAGWGFAVFHWLLVMGDSGKRRALRARGAVQRGCVRVARLH